MTEWHELGLGVSQSSSEELIPGIAETVDKSGQLAAKWEKACKKYEASLKLEARVSKTARKAQRSENAAERALADVLKVKREIDQFVLANKSSAERRGEPFFVGMINFTSG
jgi:hypothetical protein